jgi:hypothetical protein
MKVKHVNKTKKNRYLILGVLTIASIFVVSNNIGPKPITESKNVRFNQWVKYYSKCEGYTVEHYNFDDFKSESDVVTNSMANAMAIDVQEAKQLLGFVTVYFDWERDIIFFQGTGPDSTLQYCIFSVF